MANMRTLERRERAAHADYVKACAALVALRTHLESTTDVSPDETAAVAQLRRRAGAYRIQHEAAQRNLEQAIEREAVR